MILAETLEITCGGIVLLTGPTGPNDKPEKVFSLQHEAVSFTLPITWTTPHIDRLLWGWQLCGLEQLD